MPDKNIFDILSQLALSVPGVLGEQADIKNQNMLNNLNYGMQEREAKEKSKHTKFMEKLALGQLMQNQRQHEAELGARKEELNANKKPPSLPSGEAGILEWLKSNEPNAYPQYLQALIKAKAGKSEESKKTDPTQAMINNLVEKRGGQTHKSDKPEMMITPGKSGLLWDTPPDTAYIPNTEPVPYSGQELSAYRDTLQSLFGGQQTPVDTTGNNGQISLDAIDALIKQLEQELGGQ